MEKYLNAALSPEERAKALISEMSMEEKLAQTNCILVQRDGAESVKERTPFGMGEISTLEVRRMESIEEVSKWQRTIQKQVMENSPHHIPAIFHMEGLCGALIRDAVSFPSGIGRASSWDKDLEEKIGSIVGRQECSLGIPRTLAPVLDISRDSRMGRQGETYGEDPALAAALGTAYTKGIQATAVGGRHQEACAKHFMGFHNSEAGIHGAASDTPVRLLNEIYGKPFASAIKNAGLKGVMPSYNTYDGEPASSSSYMLTDILRGEMEFEGMTVSDYSAVENIHSVQHMYETFEDAGYAAMAAGMDLETPNPSCFNDRLLAMFKNGQADPEVLDRAVLRILTAKFRMGLFENPYALDGGDLAGVYFEEQDKEVSLASARESLVLLKNENVLPVRTDGSLKKLP